MDDVASDSTRSLDYVYPALGTRSSGFLQKTHDFAGEQVGEAVNHLPTCWWHHTEGILVIRQLFLVEPKEMD